MEIKNLKAKNISYGGKRNSTKFIVVHYTGNATDTAKANANYFSANGSNTRNAGAHYFVDDNDIYSSVPKEYSAYAVGGCFDSKAKFYNVCTNNNSVSIELCSTKSKITDKTLSNAAWLIKKLMSEYNISLDHVITHRQVNGKVCPRLDS